MDHAVDMVFDAIPDYDFGGECGRGLRYVGGVGRCDCVEIVLGMAQDGGKVSADPLLAVVALEIRYAVQVAEAFPVEVRLGWKSKVIG